MDITKITDPDALTGKDRPLYVKAVLESLGWTDYQAAAMVGQFMREDYADLRITAIGDISKGPGHEAHGMGQWRNDRLANLIKFAGDHWNGVVDSLRTQAYFADWELRNTEKDVGDALKASRNLEEALLAAIGYERPAHWTRHHPERGDGFAQRKAFAESLLAA